MRTVYLARQGHQSYVWLSVVCAARTATITTTTTRRDLISTGADAWVFTLRVTVCVVGRRSVHSHLSLESFSAPKDAHREPCVSSFYAVTGRAHAIYSSHLYKIIVDSLQWAIWEEIREQLHKYLFYFTSLLLRHHRRVRKKKGSRAVLHISLIHFWCARHRPSELTNSVTFLLIEKWNPTLPLCTREAESVCVLYTLIELSMRIEMSPADEADPAAEADLLLPIEFLHLDS